MARPRRHTYTMSQYLENVRGGYISNDADTQRKPAWKTIIDSMARTILTDDYIPALILAEENNGQSHIVDGGSRTFAFFMLKYGNYKIKKSVEKPIIKYKSMSRDENGSILWKDEEFDIRNKTYGQFPKELQKRFNEYQVETVIHENCDEERISELIKMYNEHSAMSVSQKAFTYIAKFAKDVHNILENDFFIDCGCYKEKEKENGVMEKVILESVMAIFHLNEWKKTTKQIATYLNNNAAKEEFDTVNNYFTRLKVVGNEFKDLFSSKNTFIWLSLFDKFNSLDVEDAMFTEFLREFKNVLKFKEINGVSFDELDQKKNTKDKTLIIEKIELLEQLMNDFISEKTEELNNNTTYLVKEVVNENCTKEDIEFYESLLDDYFLEVDNGSKLLEINNKPSLVAIVGYACNKEDDILFARWIVDYFEKENTYKQNQKENYFYMKNSFDNFVKDKR